MVYHQRDIDDLQTELALYKAKNAALRNDLINRTEECKLAVKENSALVRAIEIIGESLGWARDYSWKYNPIYQTLQEYYHNGYELERNAVSAIERIIIKNKYLDRT